MKRIINGKRYDTATATQVAYVGNNLSVNDFGHDISHLYVTKNGNWFIAGEGGPSSRWAVPVGNNGRGGGDGICAVSKTEAREILERHDHVDAIEEYFAEQVVDA